MWGRFLIGPLIGLIGVLIGCGGSTIGTYREGRLYVVNNVCGYSNLGENYDRIFVEWEGEEVPILRNMSDDGSWTQAGAVLLTSEPLPGGTPIDFTYYFQYVGDKQPMRLSEVLEELGEEAIIDGDITIDIYSAQWNPRNSTIIECFLRSSCRKFK